MLECARPAAARSDLGLLVAFRNRVPRNRREGDTSDIGVVLLSLVLQGMTMSWLLGRLELVEDASTVVELEGSQSTVT